MRKQPKGLGTMVEKALSQVGITEERVTKWLGRPCGCSERKRKLNALSTWALGLFKGTTTEEDGRKALDALVPNEVAPSIESESPVPPISLEQEAERIFTDLKDSQGNSSQPL